MSEAKHTPGPWSLETVPTSSGSCHKIGPFPGAGHRPEVHACVYADGVRIGIDEAMPAAQELLANARLLAAAPELLTAAIEAMAAMDSEWQTSSRDDDWIYDEMGSELASGYFSLRSAIAKAKGHSL